MRSANTLYINSLNMLISHNNGQIKEVRLATLTLRVIMYQDYRNIQLIFVASLCNKNLSHFVNSILYFLRLIEIVGISRTTNSYFPCFL